MMHAQERELEFLRFLDGLTGHLKPMRDAEKALRVALRDTREFFRAEQGCVAVVQGNRRRADLLFAMPKPGVWDHDLLFRFIRHQHPRIPDTMLVAPLRRRDRTWAALALARPGSPYGERDARMLSRITTMVSDAVQSMDRERMLGVRERIDRKIMEQVHPKDLFYQILDGLRTLTHYDHSSALLIRDETSPSLRLEAEQIAWTKAKSVRIGLRVAVPSDLRRVLESGRVYGFNREGTSWVEWSGEPASDLAALLDYNRDGDDLPGHVRENCMLCAPLVTRDGLVGLVKVAARDPGRLSQYDSELVEQFRSQAAIAIQNLKRTESFRSRMLTAERKHAMAELARSVSHDVNNALGSMLPLVQQIEDDFRFGKVDPPVHIEDLAQIRHSLQVCRRIFGGMLAFARGGSRRGRSGQVRRAVETALAILRDGMERRGIQLQIDIPSDLTAVACGQGDLEQLFLNLLTNAREAMPAGGSLVVRARAHADVVTISVADTGCGIPPEHLLRVQEPFFTTKPHGNGLGLSICRSILWEIGGKLTISSEPDQGTRVEVAVPRAALHQHAIA
jgi:two-component system, NtrC family, sensor kinase